MSDNGKILKVENIDENINNKIKSLKFKNPKMLILTSDEIKLDCFEGENIEIGDRLLDIRIFDENKELRIWRDNIDEDYFYRVINDEEDSRDVMEEKHLLDIDTKKSHNKVVVTTGGGKYNAFTKFNNLKYIHIKNYLNYYESGQVYVQDWRICYIGGEN